MEDLIIRIWEMKGDVVNLVAYLVLAASVLVKLIPTLDKGNRFLPFIKFIGRYIALEKYGPSGAERPKEKVIEG